MSDDTTKFEGTIPVPTLELWMLLKKYPLPKNEDGAPAPGSERLHAAHQAASEWLSELELELGCPSFERSSDWAEFEPVKRQYGLCPKCECNNGYMMVGSSDEPQYWSFCHRHRVRWEIAHDDITDSFRIFAWDSWEDPFRPVWKYTVVKPLRVDASTTPDEATEGPVATVRPFSPQPQNSARPHLRLVSSQSEPQEDEFGPPEPWPPPGEATFKDHALRIVSLVIFFTIFVPRELVLDALEYFAPEEDD